MRRASGCFLLQRFVELCWEATEPHGCSQAVTMTLWRTIESSEQNSPKNPWRKIVHLKLPRLAVSPQPNPLEATEASAGEFWAQWMALRNGIHTEAIAAQTRKARTRHTCQIRISSTKYSCETPVASGHRYAANKAKSSDSISAARLHGRQGNSIARESTIIARIATQRAIIIYPLLERDSTAASTVRAQRNAPAWEAAQHVAVAL